MKVMIARSLLMQMVGTLWKILVGGECYISMIFLSTVQIEYPWQKKNMKKKNLDNWLC
jgi:hypothetical protein